MSLLVFNCSMNADSRSFALAQAAMDELAKGNAPAKLYDLRELQLPLADPVSVRNRPDVRAMQAAIQRARAAILSFPIYNHEVNAATKNLFELTGGAWKDKIVGMLGSAASRSSQMAFGPLATSLMIDYRCLIVPRFVLGVNDDFSRSRISSSDLTVAVRDLCAVTVKIAGSVDLTPPQPMRQRIKRVIG